MLYFFNYKWGTVEPELKMNGNTTELHGWPLEGGGGTVCPDSICALRNAGANGVNAHGKPCCGCAWLRSSTCRRAEQSRADNTVLLARDSEDCYLRTSSSVFQLNSRTKSVFLRLLRHYFGSGGFFAPRTKTTEPGHEPEQARRRAAGRHPSRGDNMIVHETIK